jgi:hypothetical protein
VIDLAVDDRHRPGRLGAARLDAIEDVHATPDG